MRLWVETFDASDRKTGVVYNLTGADVTEVLDQIGSISLSFPADAEDENRLIVQESHVRIWIEQDNQRLLFGSGVIRQMNIEDSDTGARMVASGPDLLDELARKSTLLTRIYTNQTVATIAADLVALVDGWQVDCDDATTETARFEGISAFKALVRVAQEKGLHLRTGDDPKTVQISAMGEDNGFIAIKPGTLTQEVMARRDIALISKLKRTVDSRDVVNWIIPIGAGTDADNMLTLADSSHTVSHITGPSGAQLYYLSDTDSIESYGQIEQVVQFKNITDADALYDAATAWLARQKDPVTGYTVTLKKCRSNPRVGDLIKIIYKGVIQTEDGHFTYVDVNDLFWVMSVRRTISDNGVNYDLDIASIDRMAVRSSDVVNSAVENSQALTIATSVTNTNTFHTAAADPTVNDDSGDGYAVGWLWINTTSKTAFVLMDSTVGAAVWHKLIDSANQPQHYFAVIEEQQASGTAGGASVATTWTKRVLNATVSDDNSLVELAVTTANCFTPIAGTFRILASSPFLGSGAANESVRIRLWNTTQGTEVVRSPNFYASGTTSGVNAFLDYQFTANGTDEYEIDYYSTTARATNGLGLALSEASAVERYTRVSLYKQD